MGLIVFGDGFGIVDGEVEVVLKTGHGRAVAVVDESDSAVVEEATVLEMGAVEGAAAGSLCAVGVRVRLMVCLSCLSLARTASGEVVVVGQLGR